MVGESSKGLEFDPGGIGSILKSDRFRVPLFQREYAWETEEVDQLFDDLKRANSEDSDHFLGTVVTIRSGSNLEIVDGQQRLTTTSLLIVAIRDALVKLKQPEKVVESVNNDYLYSYDRKSKENLAKLTLNIDDNDHYQGLISNSPKVAARESHRRLDAAKKEADSFVKRLMAAEKGDEQKADLLQEWLEFIEKGASVILVKTDNASKAFRMFETLNDRGLRTSQADLVKSYLFGQVGERVAEAQAKWTSMKDNLEEIDDDDRAINFLRHVLIATKQFVRAESVYDTVQKQVRGKSESIRFLSNIEAYSRTYVATYQPSAPFWKKHPVIAVRAVETFNRFDLKPLRPLVFAVAEKFSPTLFANAMQYLVALSVRMVIAGKTRSGTIEQTAAGAALGVTEGKIDTMKKLKTALSAIAVSDADFKQAFINARVSNANLARYYLRALESARAAENQPWFIANDDPAAITLEHVLPQRPKSGWANFSAEERKMMTKRLGNLCLLTKSGNEGIGNTDFADKAEHLKKAQYKLTAEIGRRNSWNVGEIEARQKRMAELALKAWKL